MRRSWRVSSRGARGTLVSAKQSSRRSEVCTTVSTPAREKRAVHLSHESLLLSLPGSRCSRMCGTAFELHEQAIREGRHAPWRAQAAWGAQAASAGKRYPTGNHPGSPTSWCVVRQSFTPAAHPSFVTSKILTRSCVLKAICAPSDSLGM